MIPHGEAQSASLQVKTLITPSNSGKAPAEVTQIAVGRSDAHQIAVGHADGTVSPRSLLVNNMHPAARQKQYHAQHAEKQCFASAGQHSNANTVFLSHHLACTRLSCMSSNCSPADTSRHLVIPCPGRYACGMCSQARVTSPSVATKVK